MRVPGRSVGARVLGMPRRPLVVCLLAALLFELSLLAGVLASSLFQEWLPRRSLPMDDTTAMLVRWRRSVFHRELDPRVVEPAPPLTLRGASRARLDAAALRGKNVALIFAGELTIGTRQ